MRSPAAHLLAVSLTAVAFATAAQPAVADPVPPPGGPSCDQISGQWLGQTKTWRIIIVSSKDEAAPLIACRRDVKGPALVRVLGTTKTYDDEGEDSDEPDGGPYVDLFSFEDGRLAYLTRTFSEFGSVSVGTIHLVDLDHGVSVDLGSFSDHEGGAFSGVTTLMTPSGGIAYAPITAVGDHSAAAGAWTVWDADGSRPAGIADGTRTIAPSIGAGGDTGGIYYRDADDTVGRVPLRGAADLSAVAPDPALAWQALDLPAAQSSGDAGYGATFLYVDDRTIYPNDLFSGSWPVLEYSTSSTDPHAKARLVTAGEERVLAKLAPRSVRDFTVLDAEYGGGLFAGRFTTHPKQRRILAGGGGKRVKAFFDVPARRAMERPGQAYAQHGLWGLVDGNRVRTWIAGHGAVRHISGAHDLTSPTLAGNGLFVTDGAGRARYLDR